MGERNDLIEMQTRFEDQHPFALTIHDQGLVLAALTFAASNCATTIASLSRALAEAEKKEAGARLQALEDAIGAIRTAAVTTTLAGDDAASFCNGADWMEGEAIKAIRDLSQGGQHG